jgi:hypothetical protein
MSLSIVRGPNRNYRILREDAFQIGDVRKGAKGDFHVYLKGIYFGIKDAPNRRSGCTGISVPRLKDVSETVERVLAEVAVLDAKEAAEKSAWLADQVEINANEATGEALSWLVAKALKLDIDVDYRGKSAVLPGAYGSYQPLQDLPLVITIMEKHIRTVSNLFSEKFEAVSFGAGTVGTGDSIPLASLRCFVSNELGQRASVPACLL